MGAVRPSSARLPRTARNRSGITRRFWMAVIPLSVAASRVLAHVLQRPVSLRHDNVATWHHRAAFKRAVPWSALRRLYARDEQVLLQTIRRSNPPFLLTPTLPPVGPQFYDWLTRGGPNASCVGRAESAELRSMVDILGRNSGLRIRWRDAPGPPSSNEMAP